MLCVYICVTETLHSPFDHRFSQADIHDLAFDLLNTLLNKIEAAGPPENVADNDHLMKCRSSCTMLAGANSHMQAPYA